MSVQMEPISWETADTQHATLLFSIRYILLEYLNEQLLLKLIWFTLVYPLKAYVGPSQTSMMEFFFDKIVHSF